MDNTHETIADIIAEMRRRKEMLEDAAFNAPLCYSIETMRAQCEILDEFVERFEAAHGRELSKNASKNGVDFGQLGNAAKLREALALALSLLDLKEGVPYKTVSQKDIDFIKAALAAPPRNCDMYANHNDAMKAFEAFVRDQGKLVFISHNTGPLMWLFAPATEKKGGAE